MTIDKSDESPCFDVSTSSSEESIVASPRVGTIVENIFNEMNEDTLTVLSTPLTLKDVSFDIHDLENYLVHEKSTIEKLRREVFDFENKSETYPKNEFSSLESFKKYKAQQAVIAQKERLRDKKAYSLSRLVKDLQLRLAVGSHLTYLEQNVTKLGLACLSEELRCVDNTISIVLSCRVRDNGSRIKTVKHPWAQLKNRSFALYESIFPPVKISPRKVEISNKPYDVLRIDSRSTLKRLEREEQERQRDEDALSLLSESVESISGWDYIGDSDLDTDSDSDDGELVTSRPLSGASAAAGSQRSQFLEGFSLKFEFYATHRLDLNLRPSQKVLVLKELKGLYLQALNVTLPEVGVDYSQDIEECKKKIYSYFLDLFYDTGLNQKLSDVVPDAFTMVETVAFNFTYGDAFDDWIKDISIYQ